MKSRILPRSRLDCRTRATMHHLLQRSFEGVDSAQFDEDLASKDWVLLLEDANDELAGFSTLATAERAVDGEQVTVLYSGDTIVDPRAWQEISLSRAWIAAVQTLGRERGWQRVMWLLLVSGYRTYRYLPLFFRSFWPRHDCRTPPEVSRLMHELARVRYGPQFDAGSGVVRFVRPHLLHSDLAGIPKRRLRDPHTAYFDRTNPGHRLGDELVCLTEIADWNLTRAGRRVLRDAPPDPSPQERAVR